MRSLVWLALVVFGLAIGPPLGLILCFAVGGEDRWAWTGLLAVIAGLVTLAGWIVRRADRREAASRRP